MNPEKAAFSTWLYRITVNKCLDFKRKQSFEALEEANTPADTRPDAVTRIHTHQVARQLRGAIATLSEPQRIAVALYYQEGLRAHECAEIMEMSVNAVESLLKRARKKLRETMSEAEPTRKQSDQRLARRD